MNVERRATLWLLAMCAVWGSSFFSMQLGTEGLATVVGPAAAPTALIFLRFLVAAALFLLVFPRAVAGLSRGAVGGGVLLAVPFYAGFLLQVTGLRFTTPTVSAFITNLTVALTPFLGRVCFGERLSWANVIGAAVALLGVYVLSNPAGGGFGAGELLTAASAVAFAFQIQLTNRVTRRHPPESVTFVMFVSAVVFSGATLAFMGVPWGKLFASYRVPNVAWTVVYNATACSIVAISIMNRFQRDITPTRAAVLYTLEPVFAALFAWGFVSEEMTLPKILGGAIIVGGNLVCELFRRTPPAELRE